MFYKENQIDYNCATISLEKHQCCMISKVRWYWYCFNDVAVENFCDG